MDKEAPTGRKRPESDGLRQLKNETEDILDIFRRKGFIQTTQTVEAKKLLQDNRFVVISGKPGEGKTSTAFHLIDNDDYRNQRVVVRSLKNWKKVDTDWVKIIVLDDIFGQYDLDPDCLKKWVNKYLHIIQDHVHVGNLQVIITIRKDILFKAYSKLKSFKLFSSDMSLILSLENLNHSDKMSILNRELQRNNKDMNVGEIKQCIAKFSGVIGFPQCCSLFAQDKHLFSQGPDFFKSPKKFLADNIRNLETNSFLSLAFLFCIGEIEEEYLSPSQIKESKKYLPVLEDLAKYLNISYDESTVISLRESYDCYSGLYVKKVLSYKYHSGGEISKSCIQFSHATVYEAVEQVFGERFPEMVVKHGDSEYLYQRTYTGKAKDDDSQNVFIPVSIYGLLVERMVHDVVEKGIVESVVKHSVLKQNQFLMKLKDELHKGNRIRDFLMAESRFFSFHQDVSEGKCTTFLQHVLQSDEGTVKLMYSHFMEFLACTHNNNSSDCWQCEEKQKLLELALYYHHFEIADKLITMNACYTNVSLCNAARHGDLNRVKTILEDLKRRQVFNPDCIEAKEALSRANMLGNQDVIAILSQEGITCSVIPVEILRMDDKSIQLFKEALQDGMEKVYNIRVMVVGHYGAGKTTLTKRLLGHPVDISERNSTEGIDIYKHCCKISLDTGKWIVQDEDSDQLSQLQRLVKILADRLKRPEVSGEQKQHTEVIYEKETIPEDSDSSDSSLSDIDEEVDITKKQPEDSSSVMVDLRPSAMEASSVTIQESGRHVASKDDVMKELLQLVIEKADKIEKSVMEYAALAMWDFAGQSVFYTTHQTFLTRRAIYLLVTDLCKQITDLVEDDECNFDIEGIKLCQVQELVQVWLNSIHCCAPSSTAGTSITAPAADTTSSSSSAGIPVTYPAAGITVTLPTADTAVTSHGTSTPITSPHVCIPVTPPVILVGTHADRIKEGKRQEVMEKYFQQIYHILKDKPSLQHIVDYFAIDNNQVDPQLEALKKKIFELASEQPYWGEVIPANWLPLEEAVMKLRASGTKVIPCSLVEEMNQAAAVPIKTTEQLDLFLRFQHEIGNILYFSAEGLREWIVLDPKWIIDALKSLITSEAFILKNKPAIRNKWTEFREKGKLTPELIDAVWAKEIHPEFHDHKEFILQLMEKLNIVAKPRLYSPDAEEVKVESYFLAPCMLREKTPKELLSLRPNSQQGSTSVLCFVFTGQSLPLPVFHRFLAACVAQWEIANKGKMIFCGSCLFNLDLHHKLTLLFKEHVIFARVTRMGVTEKIPSSKLCIGVREFITRTLSDVVRSLGQILQVELSIQCPESDEYSVDFLVPVATLKGNVEVPCDFYDFHDSHVIMSHDVLNFWFQEEETSVDGSSASPMPPTPTGDTDRFMRIAYLLVDVGSQVLRQLLSHHAVTSVSTLDQYLANSKVTINSLVKKKVLNQSQMDIMFPPNGDNTNLDNYDVTLLSALFNNIVPSLSHQEMNMIKSLREDRNKLYGHAKSCKINASDFQTYWNDISSTMTSLSQLCGDAAFEANILQEIQCIQISAMPAGYLDILKTWFDKIETVEGGLKNLDCVLQNVISRLLALESKEKSPGSES